MKNNLKIATSILFLSLTVDASNQHEATPSERAQAQQADAAFTDRQYLNTNPGWRPVADTAAFRYVVMSAEADFSEAQNLRYTIAKNLPPDVQLVLLVNTWEAQQIKETYLKYIPAERLILAKDGNTSGGFWARDSFPYPIVDENKQVSLVSAKYYRPFGAGASVANTLKFSLSQNNFTFVGGNLIADTNGVCFTIDSDRKFTTTENDLRAVYGCKNVHYLKHLHGIGDVDEVMKPLSPNLIVTNTPEYVDDFKSWGYQVVMLPAVPNSYRTYANSLVVGKTVFMPTYGISQDAVAQKVYENLGYQVVGIRSNTLSDQMHGSIHCQTMAYPDLTETNLLAALGVEKVN